MKTNFKFSLLATSLLVATTANATSFSAKNIGQGFTSVTKDFTSSISNPALINRYDDDDDFALLSNVGAAVADEYDVIDTGEDINDKIDILDKNIDQMGNIPGAQLPDYLNDLNQQVADIVSDLKEVDNKPVHAKVGFNMLMPIPNKYLNMGVFMDVSGRIGMMVDYAEDDEQTLSNAINSGSLDINDLNSNATGLGYTVADAGFIFGGLITNTNDVDINYGVKLKYQRIDLFYNQVSVADFDQDEFDLTDDEFLHEDSSGNIDFGLHATWGEYKQWHFGLTANNLLKHEVNFAKQNLKFDLKTTSTAGLSYDSHWINVSLEADLTKRDNFNALKAVQYVSTGIELKAAEHAQFRLGFRSDLENTEEDVYTVGLGVSPWDMVFLDLAAFKGDNDFVGGAIQLGFKI